MHYKRDTKNGLHLFLNGDFFPLRMVLKTTITITKQKKPFRDRLSLWNHTQRALGQHCPISHLVLWLVRVRTLGFRS